jgi:hypothetical protein
MKPEEGAAMPLAGGLMGYGYQCGMLWGAALAAGAQAYRLFGTGPQAETEAVIAAQRLVEAFRAHNKYINCSEITEMNWKESSNRRMRAQVLKYFLKGGPIVCFTMSAKYARVTFSEINLSLSEKHNEASCSPASCAAVLAKKMGASDLHAVMAAGFAGGIGLSGSACGALGAAIWLIGMDPSKDREGEPDLGNLYNNPLAIAAIERFLESTDYEFECSKIVGKKFANVAEHAEYLHGGGCSNIIEALANP